MAFILTTHATSADLSSTQATHDLIDRVLPGHTKEFRCERIADDQGLDVFEIKTENNTIVLSGNSNLSISMAFNWYLRYVALINFDWRASKPLEYTGSLPLPANTIRKTCLAHERFFLNYCTFGYTLPFIGWEAWERFIDWMAMNGINRPLLQSGQEAVWYRVWMSYGLDDKNIRTFFTGPAHLPWQRMANIDKWDGPLPMSYIDGQMTLQQKIVRRARSLDIKPILPGFAGHVPEALGSVQPKAHIIQIKPGWAGMDAKYTTYFLDPTDPLFADIQQRFLKQQMDLYGTDHLYGADPFNEITPPSWEPAYMASVAKSIYEGMKAADPDAVWYQMSWTFSYIKQWLKPSALGETPFAAMAKAIPKGKMIFLDYHGEYNELYHKTDEFSDSPFIWNYLANFGGCTYMLAPLDRITERVAKVLPLKNCRGVGSTLEGVSVNPIGYDLTFEQPWHENGTVDYHQWITDYAKRRAGRDDPAVINAWTIFTNKILVGREFKDWDHGSELSARPSYDDQKDAFAAEYAAVARVPERSPSLIAGYIETLDELFKASPESQKADGYQFDIVNLVRQVLAYQTDYSKAHMMRAYQRSDLDAFRTESETFLHIIRDVDTLVGTRHEFLIGSWIRDARAWGSTPAEADYYENNARLIVSTWYEAGVKNILTDYAAREWNGMLADYYLPRWKEFIHRLEKSLLAKQPLDFPDFQDWMATFEGSWANGHGASYITQPQGDAVQTARTTYHRYRDLLIKTSTGN